MNESLIKTYDYGYATYPRPQTAGSTEASYELRDLTGNLLLNNTGYADPTPELTTYGNIKLGWIQGVLIPCLLNIWGVMLFLRIAWVVAQAGIALSVLIVFMAGVVCVITTLSLSAICTNGELQGGGVYFLVSRSLGAELGASVGIIFAFANAVAASMNTIGFCDSLNELLKSHNIKIIDNDTNDTRIVGTAALFVMCVICAIGMDWETKTQNLLIVIIVTAIANFILGVAIGPSSDEARSRGFVGLSVEQAKENLMPDFRFSEGKSHNFFTVFAIYFPAVTGVQAGANICGDLKDPATAIPKGTLLALAISFSSYLAMIILSGTGALRDASGNTLDLANSTIANCKPSCHYGLHNSYEIMHLMSLWSPLIYAGCWAATLSTALTNLLSVPRLIQALGLDRIYPGLIFFSKRYGAHGEPYRGYVLTFVVSLCFLLIADLNTIAPLITNFYLASYALINFCTFHAAFFKPISWRPRFRFYNTWVSLAGFIICVLLMMLISWVMALITTFIFITLYLLVLYRKPEISWGSSTDAQRYQETITSMINIYHRAEYANTFNPQLLVLSGQFHARPWLLDLSGLITKIGSFMIMAEIEPKQLNQAERIHRQEVGQEWLKANKLRGFHTIIQGFTYVQALQALIQSTGLGRMAPNIVLLGFKYNWDTCPHPDLLSYYQMIRMPFQFELAVTILHVPPNMRPAKSQRKAITDETAIAAYDEDMPQVLRERPLAIMSSNSDIEMESGLRLPSDDNDVISYKASRSRRFSGLPADLELSRSQQPMGAPTQRVTAYKRFRFNHDSILDAWWLYDDGGLNILLPYIIARRSVKEKMVLRIFALPRGSTSIRQAEKHMAAILKKYRIDYSQLTMVTGLSEQPGDSTWAYFNDIIKHHKSPDNDEILLSDEESSKYHLKTCRYLRLRELLMENSYGADFIVMTLPLPRQGISAALYMAWLEVMSHDMPPILFVRGNSTMVIE